MALEFAVATEADVNEEWVALLFDAFGGYSTLNNAIHPGNMTPEGRERGFKFYKHQFNRPETRFVKVTKDGELVGVADYEVFDLGGQKYPDDPNPLVVPDGNWDSKEDAGWAQALVADLMRQRNLLLSEKPRYVVSLIRMAVKKPYQRQGAGKLMMKYGTDLADSLGAEMTVEAGKAGKLLYEQFGYIDPYPSAQVVKVPEIYADRPECMMFYLNRPAAKK